MSGRTINDRREADDRRGIHPVPRRAKFDDLRVGQVVAWASDGPALSGQVKAIRRGGAHPYAEVHNDAHHAPHCQSWQAFAAECERGEVAILRDAPAPPVTVRREDYDALVAALHDGDRALDLATYWTELANAARALIDNAEGADH